MKLATAVMLMAVCAIAAGEAQDTVRVRAGAPAWGASVQLKQLYTLGGPPDYDIGAVHTTAIDKLNRVYVFDIARGAMRAYDANGRFVRTMGGRGAGPGEFRVALGATIVRDSILAIYDPSALRIVYFSPDGRYLESAQFRRPLTLMTGQLRSDAQDHLYFRMSFIFSADGGGSEALPPARQQMVRVAPDGRFVDSMPLPQFPENAQPRFNSFTARGAFFESPAGAIVYGDGDTYRFTIKPFRGAPRVVEKAWTPVPFEDEERTQVIARADEVSRRDPQRPGFSIPRTKPAFRDLFVDQDGRIWVDLFARAEKRNLPRDTSSRALPHLDWRQSPEFDVFDATGRYLANIKFPYGSTLWSARGDRVYVKSTGPEGESRLIAYQIGGR